MPYVIWYCVGLLKIHLGDKNLAICFTLEVSPSWSCFVFTLDLPTVVTVLLLAEVSPSLFCYSSHFFSWNCFTTQRNFKNQHLDWQWLCVFQRCGMAYFCGQWSPLWSSICQQLCFPCPHCASTKLPDLCPLPSLWWPLWGQFAGESSPVSYTHPRIK